MVMTAPYLVSIADIKRAYKISPSTVRRDMKQGKLTPAKTDSRKLFFFVSDVAHYVQAKIRGHV